jgi:hypothetical protein
VATRCSGLGRDGGAAASARDGRRRAEALEKIRLTTGLFGSNLKNLTDFEVNHLAHWAYI